MNKVTIIGAIAVLALLVGGYAVFKAPVNTTTYIDQNGDVQVGASSAPGIVGGCVDVEGINTCYTRRALSVGTTTSCAIRSPNATSTLKSFVARITGGHQVSVVANVTKGAAMQASTTAISTNTTIAAGAQATIIATTSATSAVEENNRTFAPSNWVQANFQGGVGTASTTGVCQAVFETV